MDWTELVWSSPTPGDDPLAAFMSTNGSLIRSALDEAAAAAILGPASIVDVQITLCPAEGLPDGFVPISTFELLGTSRRPIGVALDPTLGNSLGGTEVSVGTIGAGLLEAFDAALGAVVGEGLNLGPADGLPPDGDLLLVHLAISSGTDANATPEIAVVAVVALAARAELATHLEALQALSSPAPTANPIGVPAEPAPGSIAAVPPLVAPDFGAVSSSTNGTHAPIAASPVLPAPTVRAAQFPVLTPVPPSIGRASLELLLGVSLEVSVEIGRTQMTIRDVLALTPGSIVELDKLAGEKVDVLVNRHHVATGEVVVVDENFGVRVTEIVARDHRLAPFEGRP